MNKEDLIKLRDNAQAIIDGKEMEYYATHSDEWYSYDSERGNIYDLGTMTLRVKPEPQSYYVREDEVFIIARRGYFATEQRVQIDGPLKIIEVLDD